MKDVGKKKEGSTPRGRRGDPAEHDFSVRLAAVRLHISKQRSAEDLAEELGVAPGTIYAWCKRYREHGEDGLILHKRLKPEDTGKVVIREKITEIKKDNPGFGVKKISQFLRRMLFLPASPETVRRTLHKEGLMKPARKPRKNIKKVRHFERAKPGQMWQSDIFTFTLLGSKAYLIGFMDDYSRYMVGTGLYRSQKSDQVIEVYRNAVADYGAPEEQLTDNGRQYVTWRGKSEFQKELRKDRVEHIRSASHHPQTLGKIERFWKTIWEEFLGHVRFETFEDAQERVKLWVKHYNHMRPNQGIEGLCPADRFFEIRKEMKELIEKNIEQNVLELALRGKPKDPFYVVGRLGEKSVVIHAEKGEIKMMLDGQVSGKSITYDIGRNNNEANGGEEGKKVIQCAGEMPGGTVALDAEQETCGDNEGNGGKLDASKQLAGNGDEGDAPGAVAPRGSGGEEPCRTAEAAETSGRADAEEAEQAGEEAAEAAGSGEGAAEGVDESGRTGAGTCQVHNQGECGDDDSHGRGEGSECEPQDILHMGSEGAGGDAGCPSEPVFRPSRRRGGRGEGTTEEGAA